MEGSIDVERLDYAVLISLATREEAEVAAAALRADGIDAFIGNSHHAHVDWFYTMALNGLQILVPATSLGDAKQLLRQRIAENAAQPLDERAQRRDRWKLWILFFYSIGPLAVALVLWFGWLITGEWTSAYWLGPFGYGYSFQLGD